MIEAGINAIPIEKTNAPIKPSVVPSEYLSLTVKGKGYTVSFEYYIKVLLILLCYYLKFFLKWPSSFY